MGLCKEKKNIFWTDGLEYIVKITLQHKHTYGFCYLLSYTDPNPAPKPGEGMCSSSAITRGQERKENYRGRRVQVVGAGVGVRAAGTGPHEVTPGGFLGANDTTKDSGSETLS